VWVVRVGGPESVPEPRRLFARQCTQGNCWRGSAYKAPCKVEYGLHKSPRTSSPIGYQETKLRCQRTKMQKFYGDEIHGPVRRAGHELLWLTFRAMLGGSAFSSHGAVESQSEGRCRATSSMYSNVSIFWGSLTNSRGDLQHKLVNVVV
jgi:hypothetical protein